MISTGVDLNQTKANGIISTKANGTELNRTEFIWMKANGVYLS